ncbi:hypothetical protein [Methylosinus sp. Sm6]|uniref:hypothetical protein n=1 Tax=Methylosinus sp. Sm6 TaxID=2866948 RepID=UPI001C992DFC|nr:hypothetical protein [Methylosinus sp. Sm6]MBY6240444.1 hypothetical protein [Methylosinus sp. Sm6]
MFFDRPSESLPGGSATLLSRARSQHGPDALHAGEIIVNGRIVLADLDRPGEPLEVEVIAMDEFVLSLSVPNTNVQFRLFRRARGAAYEGTLGGRSFCFTPSRPQMQAAGDAKARK